MNLRSRSCKVVAALWLVLGALVVLAQAPQPPGNPVVIGGLTPPLIQNLSVTVGPVGTTVIITGTTFSTVQGTSVVRFNGTVATPTAWSNTSITTTVPVGATTGPVTVLVAGNTSNAITFTVQLPVPTLTGLSLTNGPIGTGVVLTGTNFGNTQGTSTVAVNGVTAAVTSWANISVAITIPAAATTGLIRLTTLGGTSNGLTFSVTPQLQSLSVTSGNVGTTVVLTGTTFGATQGASTVTFNGTAATASSWAASSVTVTVPAGATSGNVIVTVGGFPSNAITFTVTAPAPVLTSLSITSGPVGSTVVLTGTNFGTTQGTSLVTFFGTAATASSWSATSITVTVPANATTGVVQVIVGGNASNGITFTVTGVNSVPAASCSWSDLVAAETTAINTGATIVTVPAGPPCVWTQGQQLDTTGATRSLQLRGAGAGQTIIDATANLGTGPGGTSTIVTGKFSGADISGFTFICANIRTNGPGWRIHHNNFTCNQLNYAVYGTAVWASNTNVSGLNGGTAPLNGLIDNNTFTDQRVLIERWASGDLVEQNGATLWSEPLGLGGPNAVYAEDNTFTFLSFGNTVDCQESGEYVFRDNTVHESYPEAHTPRGYFRGCRKWEIYDNIFTQSALTVSSVAIINGGTGVIYNNTWTGTFGGNTGTLTYQRAYVNDGPNSFGLCNGASPFDGNQDATGWPCIDQIGRSTDPTPFNGFPPPYPTASQTSDPAYFWNNKINGADLTWSIFDSIGPGGATAARVHAGRDFFTSTSTAKPGYSSYQYPHPLQGSPTLTSLSTTQGPVGTTVTLTGSSWGRQQNASVVKFGTTTATVTAWSTTSITTTVPAGATSGNVTVTVNSVQSNGIAFSVGNPTLTSLSTTSGPTGTQVILTGTNFGATQGASTVQFNATTATATAWSATSITTTVPVAATTGPVRVTVGGVQSNSITFTVTGAVLTFYVSPSGNDSNTCTLAQNINTPKQTLTGAQGALTCAVPNSQVLLRGGTTASPVYYNEALNASPSGTSWNAKIRIANYPGEVVWLRPGTFSSDVVDFQANENYIELDGLNMDSRNASGNQWGVKIETFVGSGFPGHIRIQNAEIITGSDGIPNQSTGGGPIGIIVTASTFGAIGFNEFINLNMHGGGDAGDLAYSFYINASDNIIENCNLHNERGFAIQIYNQYAQDGMADYASRNIVRNNIIHDITLPGDAGTASDPFRMIGVMVASSLGTGNQVYNNIVYNISAPFGPNIFGAGIYVYTGVNTLVYNNTVYNMGPQIDGIHVEAGASGTVVRNNIAYQVGAGGVTFVNNGSSSGSTTPNVFAANPLFVNAPTDFHLQAGSPALNTGVVVPTTCLSGTGNCDIVGTTRPQGTAFDQGAFEQ